MSGGDWGLSVGEEIDFCRMMDMLFELFRLLWGIKLSSIKFCV